MNLLKRHLAEHNKTYSFLSILVVSGFFCGVLLTRWLDGNDIELLSKYLITIPSSSLDMKSFFSTQIVLNSAFIIIIYLLGLSMIGIPFIAFVMFTKGVQIGFSCALFWHAYQFKGIVGIIMTLFPQIIFELVAYTLICKTAIEFSLSLLYCLFHSKTLPILSVLNHTLTDLIISLLLILIATFLKSTVIIYLMKLFSMI